MHHFSQWCRTLTKNGACQAGSSRRYNTSHTSLTSLSLSMHQGCWCLTPSTPTNPNCCCLKASSPYWSNPPVLISDSWGSFFCFSLMLLVYVVLCLIVFGCKYQCNWFISLPGNTCLQSDLLCVEWDLKPYTLTHYMYLFSCTRFVLILWYKNNMCTTYFSLQSEAAAFVRWCGQYLYL